MSFTPDSWNQPWQPLPLYWRCLRIISTSPTVCMLPTESQVLWTTHIWLWFGAIPLNQLTTNIEVPRNLDGHHLIKLLTGHRGGFGSHVIAPSLERLHLHWCESHDGSLANLVASRWHETLEGGYYSKPLGHLQEAIIFPRRELGPVDKAFFSTQVLFDFE